MSDISPIEQFKRDIDQVQSTVRTLQLKARLSDVRDAVGDLDTSTTGLAQVVRDVRARGYAFEKGLEAQAAEMATRWAPIHSVVLSQIETQAARLQGGIRSVESLQTRLITLAGDPVAAQPVLAQLRGAITTLQGQADAAAAAVNGVFDSFKAEVSAITTRLNRIKSMLALFAEAKFRLTPTEGAVQAVKATWQQEANESGGDPKGVLYLTDQRLLFEQKQEVATKKVLFITTAKEKVQKLLWEVALHQIEEVKPSKKGLMGHRDHLDLAFEPGVPPGPVHLHIDGQDSNTWQTLISRVRSGEFDQDRSTPIPQADIDRVRQAPTACPSCGGKLDQKVLRGMDSITCEWCGALIRL